MSTGRSCGPSFLSSRSPPRLRAPARSPAPRRTSRALRATNSKPRSKPRETTLPRRRLPGGRAEVTTAGRRGCAGKAVALGRRGAPVGAERVPGSNRGSALGPPPASVSFLLLSHRTFFPPSLYSSRCVSKVSVWEHHPSVLQAPQKLWSTVSRTERVLKRKR